ncbi:hypothetical protein MTO96_032364 [Rhipicephalus appendiculatus]
MRLKPAIGWKVLPLRRKRWNSGTLIKIAASAVILMMIIYAFQIATPLTGVATSDTSLLWFPDTNVTKASLYADRLYNKPSKYLIKPSNICPSGTPVDYLLFVLSAAHHTEQRATIRTHMG